MPGSPLARVRVVLVAPSHPGNIGAAARAMKTMGLSELVLVAPRAFPHPEAEARASGAEDVLGRARVCPDLEAAVADCRWVLGSSARPRRIGWPTLDPEAAAKALVARAEHHPVALVFGCERTGLSNRELDRCQAVVSIPASAAYSSLNLAAAVQIMSYELMLAQRGREAAGAPHRRGLRDSDRPATQEELEGFFRHLERVLTGIGFLDPRHPRKLMRRLYRLFHRAGLEQREINILRGILTAVEEHAQLKSDIGTRE